MRSAPIGRRNAVVLLGGVAAAMPFLAQAQQINLPVIGFLSGVSPGPFASLVAAFHKGLAETGFVEGQNVAVEYRWAEGQPERLPALATELVERQVTVLTATGGAPSSLAAKAATATIPIVFAGGSDPVRAGLVDNLDRPSGNATGLYAFNVGLEPKRLELLRELVPTPGTIAFLLNPKNPDATNHTRNVQEAAQAMGQPIQIVNASTPPEIDAAFATLGEQRPKALLVAADPFFNNRRDQIIALAARQALPAIYEVREYAAAGGLMSYGNSLSDYYRQIGVYTGRILKGEKPNNLPVVRPSKLELVINRKTAKALGLEVPPSLLARADEVLE
jgi:putative tryptophan/tyrosine transport system substrate-binding protein